MSEHEPLARRIVRPVLAFLLKWFYHGMECSVCEQFYEQCSCAVDQPEDDIVLASLRQEIRWLRGMLQP